MKREMEGKPYLGKVSVLCESIPIDSSSRPIILLKVSFTTEDKEYKLAFVTEETRKKESTTDFAKKLKEFLYESEQQAKSFQKRVTVPTLPPFPPHPVPPLESRLCPLSTEWHMTRTFNLVYRDCPS
jgi:hypothetical protein